MASQCGADSTKFLQWQFSVGLFQLSFSSGVPVYPASIRWVAQWYPSVHWVHQWHSSGILVYTGPASVHWLRVRVRNKLQLNFNRNSYIFKQKMHLKMSTAKWRLFRLSLNVLTQDVLVSNSLNIYGRRGLIFGIYKMCFPKFRNVCTHVWAIAVGSAPKSWHIAKSQIETELYTIAPWNQYMWLTWDLNIRRAISKKVLPISKTYVLVSNHAHSTLTLVTR